MTAAEIIEALGKARHLPEDPLRQAVAQVEEIAPALIAVMERAAEGVYLMPTEANLLFWGVHALAAARAPDACQPLLRMLQDMPAAHLDDVFGDAVTETLPRVVLSLYDGDWERLIALCGEPELDGYVRWSLMSALGRLTFEGTIPRDKTAEFLTRFERESLAATGDAAWEGWQDTIVDLGFTELFSRVCATWEDGRNPQPQGEREYLEEGMARIAAEAPGRGDTERFGKRQFRPIDDALEALDWVGRLSSSTDPDLKPSSRDPAAGIALDRHEVWWLEGFLTSSKVPPGALTFEGVDGFFTALIAGPVGEQLQRHVETIWDENGEPGVAPNYDSAEQAAYVESLLARHWTTIRQRLEAGYPHEPVLTEGRGEDEGRHWAGGFLRGVAKRAAEWRLRFGEPSIGTFCQAMVCLGIDPGEDQAFTLPERQTFLDILPQRMISLHHAFRGRPDPFPPPPRASGTATSPQRKIGRNERCPCGSGKKYKLCCGSAEKRALH